LGSAANGDNGTGIRWSDRGTYGFFPLTDQYDWLLLDTAIFFVLSWFFDNLIYLKRPPWFMFTRTYWCGPRKKAKMSDDEEEDNFIELKNFLPDEDVIKEEEIIKQKKYGDNVVVVINRLTKTYTRTRCFCCKDKSQTFRAVKGIYLTIEIGRLLCLLGHNGAGKTTTISMLTGLLTPTSGDAVIFGDSIHSGMEKIRRVMGVCPQHDILWTKLTAREHLEMFAALKGLKAKDISKEVEERLRDVDLVKVANITAGNYSGGMKRRLSVAISLVGDPDIVFLDEPTTGMDPVSRRKVWNLIEKVKHNRVVLLTTHSMEEADILGDKIAIMKEGRIAALGTSIHLKNRYGAGYSIHIVGDETKMEQVKEFVLQELGKNESAEKKEKAAKKKRKTKTKTKAKKEKAEPITSTNNDVRIEFTSVVPGIINFRIPLVLTKKMAQFFKHIEEAKKDLHIEDVQLSMTTLEEVFLRVAESPEVREIVHRKIKTYKAHFIAMGIFFGLLFLAAIGLSVVFRPVNIPPQPLQAPYRGPEPPPFVPNATLDYGTFQWGIQTGDVTNTSALVSLHTNATSVNMQLLVANANISWEVVTTVDNITVANGLVQLLLTGLEPDTAYSVWFYQTADPNSRSYVARFRTAVSESTPIRKIVFGATCCLGLTDSPWYSLGKAAEEELDFFLLLGDTTYADYSQTLAQFTAAWNSTLSTEGFRNLSLSTSFIATWDDHELTYNWQFQNTPQFIALYDTALQAFRNAIPQTLGPPSRSRIWRSLRWGNTLEVFVLDVRSELNSTAGYIVSDQQLQWLKDGLLNSSCVFKLIMTSLPISNLSSILGNSSNTMLWEGYPAQRDDLINYIVQNGITGVLFISGHVQFGLLTRLAQNNTFGGSLFEAVTGPSGSQINQILRLNPFLNLNSDQFLNLVNTWTYTRFEADPLSHNMTIQYIDDQGTVVNSQSLSLDFIG
jgi:ABC-type multidrug transport system ATPase subunit/phosphodiesterase/alkaline phosphatase D-like protein